MQLVDFREAKALCVAMGPGSTKTFQLDRSGCEFHRTAKGKAAAANEHHCRTIGHPALLAVGVTFLAAALAGPITLASVNLRKCTVMGSGPMIEWNYDPTELRRQRHMLALLGAV